MVLNIKIASPYDEEKQVSANISSTLEQFFPAPSRWQKIGSSDAGDYDEDHNFIYSRKGTYGASPTIPQRIRKPAA